MSSAFLCTKLFPIYKISIDSTPLHNKHQVFFRPISSIAVSTSGLYTETDKPILSRKSLDPDSYTVSYLINSCGLSPETAISASEKLNFETPERPDSVLNLLRTHGFTQTQISNLVRKRPGLLLANPDKTLLPKLKFFHSIGVSRTDLARTLSLDPNILTRSLENYIIPCYNFLKSVVQSDKKVVAAMKHTSWVFSKDHRLFLVPNIAVLKKIEVPQSSIALLLAHYPEAILRKHDRFREIVDEVRDMGFDPLKSTFVLAMHVISGKGYKLIWDRCYKVYSEWGWSKDEILLAFRKYPQCMILSEKKISRAMDFFVNKLGWPSKEIARCPVILFYNLEKRIIPRCSIIQVLSLKGLLKKDLSLSTILLPGKKNFLERFVTKYEDEVPQLLSVYRGEMDILGL
ncbi:mitochondrial transcription termination factor family protein [Actinidia rufa]|uniref:Mitochondrial transcription termination factor family protein n=1 Tax=Actinidia rufa TaxID=165716 RepID=A0A7J0G1G5_9ERIC|nr:mitochondrial transcription termination factor family protein [Actinidia rufa]